MFVDPEDPVKYSLIALTNWMSASDEYDTNYNFAVGLNGEMLDQGRNICAAVST